MLEPWYNLDLINLNCMRCVVMALCASMGVICCCCNSCNNKQSESAALIVTNFSVHSHCYCMYSTVCTVILMLMNGTKYQQTFKRDAVDS